MAYPSPVPAWRSDLFERRRLLMDDCASYLAGRSGKLEAGPAG